MQLAEMVVYVQDFPRAMAYYRDTLGLPVLFLHEDKECSLARLATGGATILVHQASADAPMPPPLPSFVADDLDAEIAALNARGAGVPAAVDQGWGRITTFADPDGNRICLYKEHCHG